MASKADYNVYVYSHPDTHQPFYVGKGRESRALVHLAFEDAENAKQKEIAELRNEGRKPIIEIVQWNLTEDQAFAVEAALIQYIGLKWVANKLSGRGTDKLHADFLEFIYDKAPLRISPRKGATMLILSANQFYRPGMSRFELYDAIRGNLNVSPNNVEDCRLALVVYRKYVLDVYANLGLVEAGTQARCFNSAEEPSGYDLIAQFPSDTLTRRYVGRELITNYGFGHHTYRKIRCPRGRF